MGHILSLSFLYVLYANNITIIGISIIIIPFVYYNYCSQFYDKIPVICISYSLHIFLRRKNHCLYFKCHSWNHEHLMIDTATQRSIAIVR